MQNRLDATDSCLEAHLLGPPVFLRTNGESIALAGRKDRALLGYLVAHAGVAQARDRLVELIWPDAAEAAGRASLRQSLSTIRKALGETAGRLITADRDTVTLESVGLVTDLALLSSSDESPDERKFLTDFPDGDFLEGLSGISASFDNWRATEQARLNANGERLLLAMANRAEEERRFADAAVFLNRAIVLDPLAEAIYRRLMRIYVAQGRTGAALRQFRALEVLLETELAVSPEKATLDLVREIRARRHSEKPMPSTSPEIAGREAPHSLTYPPVFVAPFVETGDAEGYFASSFTESVIIALSRFPQTPVLDFKTSYAASAAYDDDAVDMASSVGAGHILSGTIRKSAGRVRVNVRLTETPSGQTTWAQSYDRNFEDIFDVEDELSAHVATAVAGRIEDEDRRRAYRKTPAAMEIIDLIMRGRHELNKYTKAGEEAARQHFEAALDIDPKCVPALAGLAISHLHEFESSFADNPEQNLAKAQRLAEHAIQLDSDNLHARYAFASAAHYRGASDLAIQHCSRALELNPNDYHTLCSQGWFLTFGGKVEEGLACLDKALSLNPFAPNSCLLTAWIGKVIEGDAEGAIQILTSIRGENMFKQGGLAASYSLLGRTQDAKMATEAFRRLAEVDFPGDSENGFVRTSSYWRRMFRFKNAGDEDRFFGALNRAGVPV
jgi:DNA-binding SARP family transcriptional activator/TolB-like protein